MSTLPESITASGSSSLSIVIPDGGPELGFRDLERLVAQFQADLAEAGLKPQSYVSLAFPNNLEFVVSFLAVTAQRCVAAPLNPAYKQSEFEFNIEDIRSSLIIVPRGFYEQQEPVVKAAKKFKGVAIAECWWCPRQNKIRLDVKEKGSLGGKQAIAKAQPDDVALVLHTSGTTGRPKAVPLTHRNLTRTMKNIIATYNLTDKDCTMLVMPLFHVHGLLCGLLATILSGGTAVIPVKFSAGTFWQQFAKHNCNWYTAVPTIHQILLRNPTPKPLPNIRFIRSCSSPLAPATFHALEKTYSAPVLEAYAMTEAAHQMTSNPLPPGKRKPGTVGVGQGVEVVILDDSGNKLPQGKEGEISIKGENVTKGYLNNPSANASAFTNGYFRTGDQGKLDEDGYVVITGRIKELINRGGEKISPIEVDNALSGHPALSEAVSFAVPDEMYGQEVHAAVVFKDGQKASEKELKDFVGEKLSKFKIPKKIYFTKVMPKTATGKIQRRIVADAFFKPDDKKPKAKL
ncbi:hypothetical protein YB2330_002825 [Saitoella coloradoensis]